MERKNRISIIFCFSLLLSINGLCSEHTSDLASLSIEELINIKVTLTSKKAQKISESPAAVFVITQEDISRSGYTSIPEILRLVPGFHVAQINSNAWAISSRGFNNKYSNKLLVLMDGRSLYNPIFSGVDWNLHDTLLEDIERIEVIRGPGGALWGTNAVNGIVNIISKSAKNTEGVLCTMGTGNEDKYFSGFRYGKSFSNDSYMRSYVKYFKRDGFLDPFSNKGHDEWSAVRGGFRWDQSKEDIDTLTFQGDIFNGKAGDNDYEFYEIKNYFSGKDLDFSGGNILFRKNLKLSNSSDIGLQAYYDDVKQSIKYEYKSQIKTIDIDFQHKFNYNNQEIIWGLGFRHIDDKLNYYARSDISLESINSNSKLFSSFFQDEFTIVPEKFKITIGSKIERNDYTGWEFQPVGTIIWTESLKNVFWASMARAVRTPSRYNLTISEIKKRIQPENGSHQGEPLEISYHVYQNIDSEDLYAYEIGYRREFFDNLYFDIAGFYNDYKNLININIKGEDKFVNNPNISNNMVIMNINNQTDAKVYGFELIANWDIIPEWHLRGSYSLLFMNIDNDKKNYILKEYDDIESPRNQFNIRSFVDLPYNIEFDTALRYVEHIPESDIDGYIEMDIRLSWKPKDNLELVVVGKNLFDCEHPESFDVDKGSDTGEVERNLYWKLIYKF